MNSADERRLKRQILEHVEGWFDDGWRDYVDMMIARRKVSNERLFHVINKVKGLDFTRTLFDLIELYKCTGLVQISRKPHGLPISHPLIRRLGVQAHFDTKSNPEGGMDTTVYIPIDHKRWVFFSVSN